MKRFRFICGLILGAGCGRGVDAQATLPSPQVETFVKIFKAQIASDDARLTAPAAYEPAAKMMARLCQSDPFFFRDDPPFVPAWLPPELLRLNPREVQITPDRASIEFGGGFQGEEYQWKRADGPDGDKQNHWTLEFTSEGEPDKTLMTFTLDKTDHVDQRQFIMGALAEFERRAQAEEDPNTVHDRVVFLLKFDEVDLARMSIRQCAASSADDWQDQLLDYLATNKTNTKAAAEASRKLEQWAGAKGKSTAWFLAAYAYVLAGDAQAAEHATKAGLALGIDEPGWCDSNARVRGATLGLQLLKMGRYQVCADLCDALLGYGFDRDYLKPQLSSVRKAAKDAVASGKLGAVPVLEEGVTFEPFKGIDLKRLSAAEVAASQPSSKPSGVTDPKQARLVAYYANRVSADPSQRNYADQVSYLVSIKRKADALAISQTAAEAFPKWWFPQVAIAELADANSRADAAAKLQHWVQENPSFIHWWYLYSYEREIGQYNPAVDALQNAVKYPLESADTDERTSPQGCAYEAACYSYQMKQYKLTMQVAQVWASPRGVYSYWDDNIYAFRAAAELALGQFADAKTDADRAAAAGANHAIWTGNLDALQKAAHDQNQNFTYDPVTTGAGWSAFYPPDE